MASGVRCVSLGVAALCLAGAISCSSGRETDARRPRRQTPPWKPGDPVNLTEPAHGCEQFALQKDVDECKQAEKGFMPPATARRRKPAAGLFEPDVRRDKEGKIDLKGRD